MNYFFPKYSQFQSPSVEPQQDTASTTTESLTDPAADTANSLKLPSSSSNPAITPISINKKPVTNKTTTTTTKILPLPVQSQHSNSSNNYTNPGGNSSGLLLPSLHCSQPNSARSYSQTPINESLRGSSTSSLMNQNSNGNNLRNKLTDFADKLSKLNSTSGRLTPLNSKLTLDFDNNLSLSSPRRPSLKCNCETQFLMKRKKRLQ